MVNCPRPIIVTKVEEPSVTNPESLPPLLSTPTVVVYSDRQHLPPLLPTPSVVVCFGRQQLPPLLPTPSSVSVVIDKLYGTNKESDSEEFIYQMGESENYVSDEEIQGDDIEKSSTSSPLGVIPVATESIHVFPKDSTSVSRSHLSD